MEKIIAFSKYLSYMVGGAEKSTYEILNQERNKSIKIISFSDIKSFKSKKKINFPKEWTVELLDEMFLFNRFFYWEYFFNRKKVKNFFKIQETEETILYTYSFYAPIAIKSFHGQSKLFIRSETDLAINKNYYQGFKKYLKYIYMGLELIPYFIYKKDLKNAISQAEVICNSKYMSKKLLQLYDKKSTVLYPFIDEVRLKKEYLEVKGTVNDKGVVFVGDSIIKGLEIAKSIALKMPEYKFYFFSRYITSKKEEGNIVYLPWQKKEVDIYKYAKVVIVPSIWEEAYGRVSREAFVLNIPVFVSNIGGLPETVNEEGEYIIDSYFDINEWINKIKRYI